MSTKKNILILLEKNRSRFVSGEEIAKQLRISRSAVWKAVKELEKDGYAVKAVTNKGYTLCGDNILSAEGIYPFLPAAFNGKIHVYENLESTNKTAKEMALAGAAHGTAVMADCQSAGRGRYGRGFHSPAGDGIYMSIILHPSELWFGTLSLVTAYTAVAVCEAAEAVTDRKPAIKWVNDVFIDGKKVCGILTEAVTDFESGGVGWVVVGIGVNFTVPVGGYPDAIKDTAGALFGADAKPDVTRNRLAAEIIKRLVSPENRRNETKMLDEYRRRLFMLGQRITVQTDGGYRAVALDVDEAGRLVVRKDNGEIVTLSSGEIGIE
jgi:BirA family biotin operon repressor/biotin-[acetyl-CoA-carboxylase] ligase